MKDLLHAPGLCLALLLSGACQAIPAEPAPPAPAMPPSAAASPASLPAAAVQPNWKERLDQPYVFLEHRGDYRDLGDTMRRLLGTAELDGIEAGGPPFALFYDDPGKVPAAGLRSRACLPVNEAPKGSSALGFEVLPVAVVAYGQVHGAYDRVPQAYPVLFAYLRDQGWVQSGPIREIYLVNPAAVQTFDELVTEVQIPWSAGR